MDASGIASEILRQDPRRTRVADERHFFQMLRAASEREAPRAPRRKLTQAE